ncbi:MAG: ATP-binding protein [Desulfobacterales bacterium]|jgi:signal transduction histidine kinase
MKWGLLWKLLLFNILPVIAMVVLIIWVAIDQLAADYFMALMDQYDVSPTETHQMFLAAIYRYLLWAVAAALGLALLLSYLLTRRILKPLSQMVAITREFAAGHFAARLDVASQDEVGELGIAFNRMADSLERIEELRKTMVADVAHELRTPLTNLRGYLEALIDDVVPVSEATLEMLQREIMRLVHLVEDLQSLARADAARHYLKREPLDLTALSRQLIGLYAAAFDRKNITVATRFEHGEQPVLADRDKLLQALGNLVDNACKYTPTGGAFSLSTRLEGKSVRITFANSGGGIAEADLPFVFERFYRADRSRSRDHGGAGIGLAIVKELIEAHGGRIGAESVPGETRIWLTIPMERGSRPLPSGPAADNPHGNK